MPDDEQPIYQCGWCGKPVVNNIWCSHACRVAWLRKVKSEEERRKERDKEKDE